MFSYGFVETARNILKSNTSFLRGKTVFKTMQKHRQAMGKTGPGNIKTYTDEELQILKLESEKAFRKQQRKTMLFYAILIVISFVILLIFMKI